MSGSLWISTSYSFMKLRFLIPMALSSLFFGCHPLLAQVDLAWVDYYDGPRMPPFGRSYDEGQDIQVDANGNVYVTGSANGINYNSDYATIKHDNSGHRLWVALLDGVDSGNDHAWALALDLSGQAHVAGRIYSFDTGDNLTTAKFEQQSVSGLPEIVKPPASRTMREGTSISFAVKVAGPEPFEYQCISDNSWFATIAGGSGNLASGNEGTIGGGNGNIAAEFRSTVNGGAANVANQEGATVSGGEQNRAVGLFASVAGGYGNEAGSVGSVVSGGGWTDWSASS